MAHPGNLASRSAQLARGLAALTGLGALLAGVPVLLWQQIGWPLPRQVPAAREISSFLNTPMNDQLIVNILACLCWVIWAGFVLETALAAADAADAFQRGEFSRPQEGSTRWPGPAGLTDHLARRVPAALISAVILAAIAARPTAAITEAPLLAAVSVSAMATPGQQAAISDAEPVAADTTGTGTGLHDHQGADGDADVRLVRVRLPRGQVHDSLWRIADRELGNPRRWHEIYALNAGRVQPDGLRLEDPDLIYPGWILQVPNTAEPQPRNSTGTGGSTEHSADPTPSTAASTTPRPVPTTAPAPAAAESPAGASASASAVAGATASAATSPASAATSSAALTTVPASAPAATPSRLGSAPTAVGPTITTAAPTAAGPAPAPAPAGTAAGAGASGEPPLTATRSAAPSSERADHDGSGIRLPSGGYVGSGLAAAVAAALIMARRRRRRSGRVETNLSFRLPVEASTPESLPQVVTLLQRAHLSGLDDEPDGADSDDLELGMGRHLAVTAAPVASVSTSPDSDSLDAGRGASFGQGIEVELGQFEGGPVIIDLERTAGLGLTGQCAEDVARAVIAAFLAPQRRPRSAPDVRLIIPVTVADDLLGLNAARPPLTRTTENLQRAVDHADRDAQEYTLRRRIPLMAAATPATPATPGSPRPLPGNGRGQDDADTQVPAATQLLVVRATASTDHALVAELVRRFRGTGQIAAVVLGSLPGGLTCEVDQDGYLTEARQGADQLAAADPGPTPPSGSRLYTLSRDDLNGILDVLRPAFSAQTPAADPAGEDTAAAALPSNVNPPDLRLVPKPEAQQDAARSGDPAVASPELAPAEVPAVPGGASVSMPPGEADHVREAPAVVTVPSTASQDREAVPASDPSRGLVGDWVDAAQTGAGQWAMPVSALLLGPQRLEVRGEEMPHGLRGKTKELLMLVLLHPSGITGDAIAETMWPGQPEGVTSLRSTMKRLRSQLRAATSLGDQMFILHNSGRYRPDRRLISCDAWDFEDAVRRSAAFPVAVGADRSPTEAGALDGERFDALRQAVHLHRGPLLEDCDYTWAETYRETLRHHALHVFVRYATAIGDSDPEAALAALEQTLAIEPYNETLYRRTMRLQAALARPEAVAGTLELLRHNLEDIDETISPQTLTLADALQHGHG